MEKVSISLEISYSQIAVFLYGIDSPFNDWTDTHVDQGFSWRKESVCFGTLSDGQCMVNIEIANEIKYHANAVRVIVVPFCVGGEGVEIASITESVVIDIPSGSYELVFSATPEGAEEGIDLYEISFVINSDPKERIILADEELNVPNELLMEASAAE